VHRLREHLTYANVMSSLAVFLILGGATAFAAGQLAKNSVGTKQLKRNAVTASKIKKNAVTTAKIKNKAVTEAKLRNGAVTTAKLGNGAVTGEKVAPGAIGPDQLAAGFVGNPQTQLIKVFKAGAVPAIGDEATSPKVELGSVGPFHFYGKCFKAGATVEERTYIELTSGAATLGSEDGATFVNNASGYLLPNTPEEERQLEHDANVGTENDFEANSNDEEFQASASDGTEITGLVGGTGAKKGNPPGGNGPFLPGDSCIVGTIAIFGS
jgi:hypothetical protein